MPVGSAPVVVKTTWSLFTGVTPEMVMTPGLAIVMVTVPEFQKAIAPDASRLSPCVWKRKYPAPISMIMVCVVE